MAVEHNSVDTLLGKVDEFFMGEGPVHKTMRSLARRLTEQGIDYALAGGMALVLYGYRRETVDVDFLLTPEGRDRLENDLAGRGYVPLFPGARKRFRDAQTGVEIDLIIAGEYPGDGNPKPVSFPNPAEASTEIDGIRVVTLEKLIELKLASGMTAPHRLRDLADVQELIKIRRLGAEYVKQLDPYVKEKYLELWSAVANAARVEGPGSESWGDQ
jgi:nucleotidyltransferase AbiEii toxin of type IV toxin-antitoxin system